MLRDFFENTSLKLSYGVPEIYKDHPTAISIRNEGKKIIEGYLSDHLIDYQVEGSAGRDRAKFSLSEQKDEEVSTQETYRKNVHFLIERSSSSQIKKKLGFICQGYEFDFQKVYGELGKD